LLKRGTAVKNIRLTENDEEIEGKVEKTMMVLKTCFLKNHNQAKTVLKLRLSGLLSAYR